MLKKYTKFFIFFVPSEILLYVLFTYICGKIQLFYSLEVLFIFHLLVFSLSFILTALVNHYFFSATGFAFIGLGLFQMGASIYFLQGLINSNIENKSSDVLVFFGIYFVLLLISTILTVKLLFKN
jgi:hypothetical protein